MTSFSSKGQDSPYCSAILSTPLSRRWWTLPGDASFGALPESATKRASIIAYRHAGEWYFTPATLDDNAWARERMTSEDLARDHASDVILRVPPGSPLRVVDLHVFIDPEHIASRKISFRLQNRTRKRVKGYLFEISSDRHDGSISVGTGEAKDGIDAMGTSREWEETDAAYTYWCQGESKIILTIQGVDFADGTSWKARRSR